MARVTIVDYGLANLRSVVNAFEYFGAEVELAKDGDALLKAERIVLPGVGAFDAGMRGLRERGHEAGLREAVLKRGIPYFGICLGMQFLLQGSEEGNEPGLGFFPGRVRKIPRRRRSAEGAAYRLARSRDERESRLFAGLIEAPDVYFVHSYFVPADGETKDAATAFCDYGLALRCGARARQHLRLPVSSGKVADRRHEDDREFPAARNGGCGMIKHRLIATLLVNNGVVVQTRKFKRTNMVGNAFTAVDFFNGWTVDEICVLEISNDTSHLSGFADIIDGLSRRCFVPLSVGGKIRKLDDVHRYIRAGADKVVVNTAAAENPALVTEISHAYGSQCVVVSIDARPDPAMPSGYRVVVDNARRDTDRDAREWAKEAASAGAGELLINSVEHDGDKRGYDLPLLEDRQRCRRDPGHRHGRRRSMERSGGRHSGRRRGCRGRRKHLPLQRTQHQEGQGIHAGVGPADARLDLLQTHDAAPRPLQSLPGRRCAPSLNQDWTDQE